VLAADGQELDAEEQQEIHKMFSEIHGSGEGRSTGVQPVLPEMACCRAKHTWDWHLQTVATSRLLPYCGQPEMGGVDRARLAEAGAVHAACNSSPICFWRVLLVRCA